MANVVYRLGKKTLDGRSEVFVRFYAGVGIDQRCSSGLWVPVEMWSQKMQRLVLPRRFVTPDTLAASEAQEKLEALRSFILSRFIECRSSIAPGWLALVVQEFMNPSVPHQSLTPLVDLVRAYPSRLSVSSGTARHYEVVAGMLERFARVRGRSLYIDTLSAADLDEFVAWLRREEVEGKREVRLVERSQNTINSKLRKIRAVCRWAVSSGVVDSSPFHHGYSIPDDIYGSPVWLTIDERDALYSFEGLPPHLAVQRDIFVFQCFVGCRVSDLMTFSHENVTPDGFLQYIQYKMRRSIPVTIRVPLAPVALEIIERYRGVDPLGRLLPFITDVKYNVYIKEVLRLAGISRMVLVQNRITYKSEPRPIWQLAASHLARRTFMANMFKSVKDARLVSSFTGHANGSQAFLRYTDVDDEMKREMLQSLMKK